jgi:hypothetical protein
VASNWSQGLPRWKPHVVGEQKYDLAHLNPRRFVLDYLETRQLPPVSVEVRVGFMSHTFTISCADDGTANPDYSRRNDPRSFNFERYRLSTYLPSIIDSIAARRCYVSNSGYGNHFVVEGISELSQDEEYWVFLHVESVAPTIARLRVRSAYAGKRVHAPHSRRRQSMMFKELLARTLGLQKQTPPFRRGS